MPSNAEIVNDYMLAWNSGDLDKVMSFLAEDCVYHNVPVPEVKGKASILKAFMQFAQHMNGIELIILNAAATGDVVMNDRIDRFTLKNGEKLDLPVAGVFKLRDGKIVLHKDYFNYPTWKDVTGISLDMERGT